MEMEPRPPNATDIARIRRKAAGAVRKLAQNTAARGTADAVDPPGPGSVRSSMPMGAAIRPELLREAVGLYRIADEIDPDPYHAHQCAMLLEQLGDHAEAAASYREAGERGYPAGPVLDMLIERCERKARGEDCGDQSTRDDMLNAFERMLPGEAGTEMRNMLDMLLNDADLRTDDNDDGDDDAADEASPPRPDITGKEVDALVEFAEGFAWDLVDGRFAQAHAKLSPQLQAEYDLASLESTYTDMVSYAETPIDDVAAQPPETDMPDMGEFDRIWVYVSIGSDDISEAVTLVVSERDGVKSITSLEWGRP